MDWKDIISKLAPTVASALGGPLAGVAVSQLADLFGIKANQEDIQKFITSGSLNSEQLTKLKELELKYQNDEKERGFKYAELEVTDRASARTSNVQGGTQRYLFWLSLGLLIVCLGAEIFILFHGLPTGMNEFVLGRILGLLDAVALQVMAYWYGTTASSSRKTELLNNTPTK